VTAHNPDCIKAKEGDVVVIGECRPLSKTKNFIILAKLAEGEFEIKGEDLASKKEKDGEAVKPGKKEKKGDAKPDKSASEEKPALEKPEAEPKEDEEKQAGNDENNKKE
jgi:hypothetical protein